ncbi:methyltransferase domain-containing protein [Rhizobium sp. WYJ-E13]|uniref:methyltransferase domain-containing protein n=1 Tax=Rhizobium sp. WYJ-E13 TaxID=2849093 RepID=UPI001C1EC517|nr:methyltransferase domain-containing protein [Rhizobium sp. WYJ-E13]
MGYYFGHSPLELDRLKAQSTVLKPITKRLLDRARIRESDVVLDLGCGAGDVSLLAAELVGPTGAVIGVDQSAAAVGLARARAHQAGLK